MEKSLSYLQLFLLGYTNTAHGELSAYFTTTELQHWCKPYIVAGTHDDNLHEIVPNNLCTGFITGVTDAHQRFVNNGFMPSYWCGPGDVSMNRLARIVALYMAEQPDDLHREAAGTVVNAVWNAYPCN